MARTSNTHPIRVDFIENYRFPVLNRLGMTFAPGKKQSHPASGEAWHRDLFSDVRRLRDDYGTDVLVSLLEHKEFEELQIQNLRAECDAAGIEQHSYSIADQKIPDDPSEFRKEIALFARMLEEGKRLVIHCKGGLGRTGTAAACIAVAASNGDISGDEAITLVRKARGGAIENVFQEEFVRRFSQQWIERRKELEFLLPQANPAEDETVFSAITEGGGSDVRRFIGSDGRSYYYAVVRDMMPLDFPDADGREFEDIVKEPFDSFTKVLDDLFYGGSIFHFQPVLFHFEYESELKSFAERRWNEMDGDERDFHIGEWGGDLTVDSWVGMTRTATGLGHLVPNDDGTVSVIPVPRNGRLEAADRDLLLYWKFESIAATAASGHPLDVMSSRQFSRLREDDRVWIVTVDGNGRLMLAGQMRVGSIVDRQTAIEATGDPNLWDGELFALPDDWEEPQPICVTDIHHIAPELRFGDNGEGRFRLNDGRITPQELQSMLEITPETAGLLYEAWARVMPVEEYEDMDDDFIEEMLGAKGGESEEDVRAIIANAEAALNDNPNDVEALYDLGVAHGRLGDFEREAEYYNKVLLLDPENLAARFNLGCMFANLGQLERARDEFKVLTDSGCEYAPAFFMLGTMEADLGDAQSGIATMLRGLELDPDDPQAHFNLGRMYMATGDFRKALEYFDRTIDEDYYNTARHFLIGKCYMELGDRLHELDSYLRVLDIDGSIFDALFAAGTAWANIYGGEEGRTIGYRETGGEFDLTDPMNHFYMGLGMLAFNHEPDMVDGAVSSADTLREMDPDLAAKLDRFIAIRRGPKGRHRIFKDMSYGPGDLIITLPGEE